MPERGNDFIRAVIATRTGFIVPISVRRACCRYARVLYGIMPERGNCLICCISTAGTYFKRLPAGAGAGGFPAGIFGYIVTECGNSFISSVIAARAGNVSFVSVRGTGCLDTVVVYRTVTERRSFFVYFRIPIAAGAFVLSVTRLSTGRIKVLSLVFVGMRRVSVKACRKSKYTA